MMALSLMLLSLATAAAACLLGCTLWRQGGQNQSERWWLVPLCLLVGLGMIWTSDEGQLQGVILLAACALVALEYGFRRWPAAPDAAGQLWHQEQHTPGPDSKPQPAAAHPQPNQCIERPCTPQQDAQQLHRAGSRVLSPVDWDVSSPAAQQQHCAGQQQEACAGWQHEPEPWASLPEAVMADVMARVAAKDVGNMRCVGTHWFHAVGRSLTSLRPSSLPVLDLLDAFPSLKALDLSNCTKDISASKLHHLRGLPVLEELTLGCHHRLIASTVTDACLVELVGLTNLRHLNLAQCVHVRDAGMMPLTRLPCLESLNISGCVTITDIGIMMIAQLTQLTSLEMPWCLKVTNIGLSALTPLTRLANLNVSGCQLLTDQGIGCLGALTNLRRLGLLNLGYSKPCVTDAALQRLSGLTKLESLNIGLNIGSLQPAHKALTDASLVLISSRFRALTQLGLMSLDISDTGVKSLGALTRLQALNLRGCARVSGACLQHLTHLTGLTDLCCLHNPRMAVDDACVAAVAALPQLRVLGLGSYQVRGTVSDSCLVPLLRTRQLLVLSLTFYKGRFGLEACALLQQQRQLQHLDLQGSVHADGALLQAVGQLGTLQSLHLSRCSQVDDGALQHLTGLSQLHTLNISMCTKVTDVGLAAVAKLSNLTHLLAQHCKAVTDSGVALLGVLEQLRVLDLSMCERVTGSGFLAFGGCGRMSTLSLNGCSSLNDAGLRAVARITSLTKLDLGSCRLITDAGVAFLAALGQLTGLDLAACDLVGDAALAVIATHMPQLATLKVNGCSRVTDAGLEQLCSMGSLLTLHLDRCVRITDAGLQKLTRLHGLTSLRISRCPNITDAGLQHLGKMSRLSTLSLAQCPLVTDVGLMALAPLTTLASLEY